MLWITEKLKVGKDFRTQSGGCHSNAVLKQNLIMGVWCSSFVTMASFLEDYCLDSHPGLIASGIEIIETK